MSEERAEGANCAQTGNHLLKQRRKNNTEILKHYVCLSADVKLAKLFTEKQKNELW